MLQNDYQFALMLYKDGKAPLGQVSLAVDWEPAREWAEFYALRQRTGSEAETAAVSTLKPIWHTKLGEPYLKGFCIEVADNESPGVSSEFGNSYFKQLAKQASALFIEKSVLNKGDRFKYLVAAFPQQQKETASPTVRFTSEDASPQLSLMEGSLSGLSSDSIVQGTQDADDFPVLIPQSVVDEMKMISNAAISTETGGILIGHLCRDTGQREVFLNVTAQIAARHTKATLTSLTFTSETWTDVRAALELRRKGEIMVGWWHSHPVREWCKDCSAESQKVCAMAGDFFSAHDHALHRTIFPRAYSVALVVNDLPADRSTYSMFGWRRGLLESRGFHITSLGKAHGVDETSKLATRTHLAAC